MSGATSSFDDFQTLWQWFRGQDSGNRTNGADQHNLIDENGDELIDENGDNIVYE